MRNNRILLFIAVIMLLKSNSYGQFSLRTKLDSLFNSDASWVDYNNNNIPDILLTGADKDLVEKTILFDGDLSGNFNPVSSNLPAADGAICVWGDFDNDGDLDLFITGDMAGELPSPSFMKINLELLLRIPLLHLQPYLDI